MRFFYHQKLCLVAAFFVVCLFMVSLTGCKKTSYLQDSAGEDAAEEYSSDSEKDGADAADDAADGSDAKATKEDEICVQVSGAVKKPGVYTFAAGSRVYEAIDAAGGLLENAYELDLNQAMSLTDGERIHVYTKEEVASGAVIVGASTDAGAATADARININTASAEELTSLSGIGTSKAEKIIAYREQNGGFSAAEELMNVSGIGQSTYDKIADQIRVN